MWALAVAGGLQRRKEHLGWCACRECSCRCQVAAVLQCGALLSGGGGCIIASTEAAVHPAALTPAWTSGCLRQGTLCPAPG